MITVETSRWDQTPHDLREQAVGADHPRTRERFLALYEISQGRCATEVAHESGRLPHTVMRWVHEYNDHGPTALIYHRSGGR